LAFGGANVKKGAGETPAPFREPCCPGNYFFSGAIGAAGAAGAMLSAGMAGAAAGGGGGGGGSAFFAQAESPIVAASNSANIIDRYLRMGHHSFPSGFIRIRG